MKKHIYDKYAEKKFQNKTKKTKRAIKKEIDFNKKKVDILEGRDSEANKWF